jgi:uncharacterized protein YjbJ (UPF0337 family)
MTNVTTPSIPVATPSVPVAAPLAPAVTPSVPVADWNVQKGKLKAKFTYLTDADLTYDEGKREEMLNRVQIKIGKTKDELTAIIAAL